MELSITGHVNVDMDKGTVIITGYEVDEIVTELGTEELLNAIDYATIVEYVAQVERDKADDEYDRYSNR